MSSINNTVLLELHESFLTNTIIATVIFGAVLLGGFFLQYSTTGNVWWDGSLPYSSVGQGDGRGGGRSKRKMQEEREREEENAALSLLVVSLMERQEIIVERDKNKKKQNNAKKEEERGGRAKMEIHTASLFRSSDVVPLSARSVHTIPTDEEKDGGEDGGVRGSKWRRRRSSGGADDHTTTTTAAAASSDLHKPISSGSAPFPLPPPPYHYCQPPPQQKKKKRTTEPLSILLFRIFFFFSFSWLPTLCVLGIAGPWLTFVVTDGGRAIAPSSAHISSPEVMEEINNRAKLYWRWSLGCLLAPCGYMLLVGVVWLIFTSRRPFFPISKDWRNDPRVKLLMREEEDEEERKDVQMLHPHYPLYPYDSPPPSSAQPGSAHLHYRVPSFVKLATTPLPLLQRNLPSPPPSPRRRRRSGEERGKTGVMMRSGTSFMPDYHHRPPRPPLSSFSFSHPSFPSPNRSPPLSFYSPPEQHFLPPRHYPPFHPQRHPYQAGSSRDCGVAHCATCQSQEESNDRHTNNTASAMMEHEDDEQRVSREESEAAFPSVIPIDYFLSQMPWSDADTQDEEGKMRVEVEYPSKRGEHYGKGKREDEIKEKDDKGRRGKSRNGREEQEVKLPSSFPFPFSSSAAAFAEAEARGAGSRRRKRGNPSSSMSPPSPLLSLPSSSLSSYRRVESEKEERRRMLYHSYYSSSPAVELLPEELRPHV